MEALARQLLGRITRQSNPGDGTEVRMVFPRPLRSL